MRMPGPVSGARGGLVGVRSGPVGAVIPFPTGECLRQLTMGDQEARRGFVLLRLSGMSALPISR